MRRGGRSEWAELTLFRPDTPKKRGLEYSDENDNLSKKFFVAILLSINALRLAISNITFFR